MGLLSGLLKTAAAGYAGHGQDKQAFAAEAIRKAQADRQASQDQIAATIRAQAAARPGMIASLYGKAKAGDVDAQGQMIGEDAAKVGDFDAPKPVVAPRDPVADHAANRTFDIANPLPTEAKDPNLIDALGPNGTTVRTVDAPGVQRAGVAAKPPRAPSGEQEKSAMFYNMMKGAVPDIDAALASGKVRGDAISIALSTPNVFGPVVQRGLNKEEQVYLRGLRAFTAGQLRKETGAAFGKNELLDVHQRLFEGGGDVPELKASKRAAREQAMETMRQAGLPALLYYESVGKNGLPNVDAAAEAADPGGGNIASARPGGSSGGKTPAQLWDAAVAKHGEAKVVQMFGPRPPG